jgi:hypothetical protein
MTFDAYVEYIGSPANLARESSSGPRADYSDFLRRSFNDRRFSDDQTDALKWVVAQPGGPASMLVIAEEWSSDCRRDVPTFARMAEVSGMQLRIFTRDGQKFSSASVPSLAEAPDSNADLMAQFLNHKYGQTWQSIPVCAFFTADMRYMYHFTEFPAIYDKDRIVQEHIRGQRAGESVEQTRARADREFTQLQQSPFWRMWTSATVDEILSALHRALILGR